MPELPEVETICKNLRLGVDNTPSILGKVISSAVVLWDKSIDTTTAVELKNLAPGQMVEDINRRGKFIHLTLSKYSLLIHLRMSGDLFIEPIDMEPAAHTRVMFEFTDGWRLSFEDSRKFGRIWLVDDPHQVFSRLGPEPLDEQFTPEMFSERLASYHRQIKPLLLDQSFIAGIGNIYADEALYAARIHPKTKSDSLISDQREKLFECIQQVLLEGIKRSGASIDWVYRGGDFQNYFKVYRRTGKPCPRCDTPIKRILVGQRGTHICPNCQPEPA